MYSEHGNAVSEYFANPWLSDQELEDVSGGRSLGESDKESEINEHCWDDLLIEDSDSDENLESMYCST